MHALIYCRVSTEEQAREGYSLDAQEKLCRHFANTRGYTIKAVYRDEGKSATTLNRPALKELLAECQRGSVQAVIVQETDRLARNTLDHLTIRTVLKKASVSLIAVNQPMLDDTPEGKMIDTILASFNQFQSDLNGRKTSKGLEEKFAEGWWPNQAPLGYLNVPEKGSPANGRRCRKIVVIDPERWPLLREGFRLYLTGDYSADAVNDLLYEKGLRSKSGKKLSHSTMVFTLRHPFYAGLMCYKGQTKEGKHKPMITFKQHQQVLKIVATHNQNACRRRKHHFLLRGFIFCNICGQRYTAEPHPKKKKAYYHCTARGTHSNSGQNVEVGRLEDQVAEQFANIEFEEAFLNGILDRLQRMLTDQQATAANRRQALWNKKNALETARDRMEEKLVRGIIDDPTFCRMRERIQQRLTTINARISELEQNRNLSFETLRTSVNLLRDVDQEYQRAPDNLKRQYLSIFWDSFLVQDRRIVQAIPAKFIQALKGMRKVAINSRSKLRVSTIIITLLNDTAYMHELHSKLNELNKSSFAKVA